MKRVVRIIVALLLVTSPVLLFAQPTDPGADSGGDPNNVEDVHLPLDNGVVVLVLIGLGYGLLRVRQYKLLEKNKRALL